MNIAEDGKADNFPANNRYTKHQVDRLYVNQIKIETKFFIFDLKYFILKNNNYLKRFNFSLVLHDFNALFVLFEFFSKLSYILKSKTCDWASNVKIMILLDHPSSIIVTSSHYRPPSPSLTFHRR